MQTIEAGNTIEIPAEVAVCPYCGKQLVSQPDSWTQRDDGTWACDNSAIECVGEPDLEPDTDAWDEWFAQHNVMPYVHWLPVDVKVTRWINQNYSFEFQE